MAMSGLSRLYRAQILCLFEVLPEVCSSQKLPGPNKCLKILTFLKVKLNGNLALARSVQE